MNAKRNPMRAITANIHKKATAATKLVYHEVIISAGYMLGKGVINVDVNEPWKKLKLHAVPLVR
jgi:hypothetical protein